MANGGAAVSRAIQREGARTVFSLAGAGHARILDALDRDGVRIVSARHETAAVVAADGYARITGRVGFAVLISKQGLPNALTGIMEARQACSPVVVILARPPISHDDPGSGLDDELAFVRPFTKWARIVYDQERLAEYVHHAAHVARSGRPGPAVLAIPQDLLAAEVQEQRREDEPIVPPPPPDPSPAAIEAAAALLAAARRPLIVAGSGAVRAGEGLSRLAREFCIPVLGHALGRGAVPEDMELGFPWPLAQVAAKEADVVLVLGARLSDRLGYGLPPRFHPEARFIQVDIAGEELRRARPIEVPIVADAGRAALALADALARKLGGARPLSDAAPGYVTAALANRLARIAEVGLGDDGPLHPYRIARDLTPLIPRNAIVVGDGADALNFMLAYLRIYQAPSYLDHYPSGSMGIGTPLAIGAAAAARELAETTGTSPRPVFLLTGDGAFGFYLAELNSIALAKLPIRIVVINDNAWGTERHGQRRTLGRTVNTDLGETRYDRIAQGFGIEAFHVAAPRAVRPALERLVAAPGPALVDCWVDREAGALRKEDPRLQMIPHDDITTSRRPHATPSVA
ncbi:MAG: thiamine pyrophosphate-binding protein [Chloroflexota bacterium]|nr:thiamine pyrophosphate-binding protein [Dehalococcoidia bacterium]MDW8255217.1 thiamine pyrophosphate-binding protein [Chloroflexota bacterium]